MAAISSEIKAEMKRMIREVVREVVTETQVEMSNDKPSGSEVQGQEWQEPGLGLDSKDGHGRGRSQVRDHPVAMHGATSSHGSRQQLLHPLGGMRNLCSSPFVRAGRVCSGEFLQEGSSCACGPGLGDSQGDRHRSIGPGGRDRSPPDSHLGEPGRGEGHNQEVHLGQQGGEEQERAARDPEDPIRQFGGDDGGQVSTEWASEMMPYEFEENHQILAPELLDQMRESINDEALDSPQKCLSAVQKKCKLIKLWEVCCGPASTLTEEVRRCAFQSERHSLHSGFDVENSKCVQDLIRRLPQGRPNKIWAAPQCTPWTYLQNVNQRTPDQIERLSRMRVRPRKQLRNLALLFKAFIHRRGPSKDFYFEWPTFAKEGWSLKELKDLQEWAWRTQHRRIYFCRVDGCMVGVKTENGESVHKPWTIMTMDEYFAKHAPVLCDGKHSHVQLFGRGKDTYDSGFNLVKFAKRIVQVWRGAMHQDSDSGVLRDLHMIESEIEQFCPSVAAGIKRTSNEAFEDDMTDALPAKALLSKDTEPIAAWQEEITYAGIPSYHRGSFKKQSVLYVKLVSMQNVGDNMLFTNPLGNNLFHGSLLEWMF